MVISFKEHKINVKLNPENFGDKKTEQKEKKYYKLAPIESKF